MTTGHRRKPSEREVRWFGALLLAVFAILGTVLRLSMGAETASQAVWIVGVSLFLLHLCVPGLRRPLYDLWMALVLPFGRVLSHVLLGAIYFGLITPVALVMRAIGRDRLERRFDPERASYWVERPREDDVARYFRQS